MRRDFEDDSLDMGRFADEGDYLERPSHGAGPHQNIDTLRANYSWVEHFEREHSGYEFIEYPSLPEFVQAPDLNDARVALISTCGVYGEDQRSFKISPGEVEPDYLRQGFREMGDDSFRTIGVSVEPLTLRVGYPYLDTAGARKDINTVFPITRLLELEEEDFIGSVAQVHLSFMGYIPNPAGLAATIDSAVDLLAEDNVNLVLLTPGDVLSHQTMAIIQRAVEAAGISTISVALCRDVVAAVGVPRAVHYRFPFGYTFGDPNDETMQLRILKETLRASAEIEEVGAIVELPYQWLEL